jgi:TolB-like protein
MSKDEDQEYFSDGISEDIITDLSKVSSLLVIARNTAFTFKGKSVDIKQVARQLEVSHVLEGSVRKAGNRVRITAQLIDGATGGHVWADRYDRDLDDIFALQDEISEAIVAALKLNLFPEEKKAIEGRRANNLEVYDKYLRARERFNTAGTAPDFLRAADMFREALALDLDFAEARGGLVQVFVFLISFAPGRAAEWREELAVIAREALARAPDHWTTHLAHGLVLAGQRDWLSADAAFTKLAALAPASELLTGVMHGLLAASVGRISEAVGVLEAARLADPLSIQVSQALYQYLSVLDRKSEAQSEYERAKDLRGGREPFEHHALFLALGSGDAPAIKAQFQRYLGVATVTIASIQRLVDVVDQPAAALALLKDEFENPANQDSMRMAFIALYAAHFGDDELALAALRRSDMAASYRPLIWEPVLRTVRKSAGFKQLVRELGLYDYWRKSGKWGDFARPLGDDDFEMIA